MNFVIDASGPDSQTLTDSPELLNDISVWVSGQNIYSQDYDKSFIEDPGADGTLIKRGGYRTTRFSLTLTYTGPDKTALCSQIRTDMNNITNRAITVTIGNENYYGCEFESNSKQNTPIPMLANINGDILILFETECEFVFTSRSLVDTNS